MWTKLRTKVAWCKLYRNYKKTKTQHLKIEITQVLESAFANCGTNTIWDWAGNVPSISLDSGAKWFVPLGALARFVILS